MSRFSAVVVTIVLVVAITSGGVMACVGARPLAMGGAFIAVADDANAVYWNPAGLTQIEEKNMSTYMLTVEGNINYQWFFSDVERRGDLVFGASGINSLNVVELTDGRKALFDNTWYQFSFAAPITKDLAFGTNLKFYDARLTPEGDYSYSSQAAGMDVSVHYQATEDFRIGLLTQDIFGSEFSFGKMKTNVRPGIAYDLSDDTTLAFDLYDLTGDTQYSVGIEERFEKGAIRAGYYHNTWTAGFGLGNGKDYSFDYCYIYDSHIISLGWSF